MNSSGDKIVKTKERMFYVSAIKCHGTVTYEIWKNTEHTNTNMARRRWQRVSSAVGLIKVTYNLSL